MSGSFLIGDVASERGLTSMLGVCACDLGLKTSKQRNEKKEVRC
jgi:hypothetical protein